MTHPLTIRLMLSATLVFALSCDREQIVLGPPPPIFIEPEPLPPTDIGVAQRELGRLLFFDKILSGDRTMSCASCHVVFLQGTEPRQLAVGAGGSGVGPTRSDAFGAVSLGRNTPDIFLRTFPGFDSLFWDGRLESVDGFIRTPFAFPGDLFELTELQALMPLVEPEEMLGTPDQIGNDIAQLAAGDRFFAWNLYMQRVLSTPGYPELFAQAFPEGAFFGFQISHLARALVAFERALWQRFDSPIDLMGTAELLGLDDALVKEGEVLFFGEAECAGCHSGRLFSDLRFHNIGVPQFGPGKDPFTGFDEGRSRITGQAGDRFAFRTPPLRNVALTAPYMHNGAYATLEEAVRHHLDREGSLRGYDASQLPFELATTMHDSPAELDAIASTISPFAIPSRTLSDHEVLALIEFLKALTSLEEDSLVPESGVPLAVPSGLPVDSWPGGPHESRLMNLGH